MKLKNNEGQEIYYNIVEKRGEIKHVIKAISGQAITGRDREQLKSRSFTQEHQARAWMMRNGYT